MNPCPPRGPAPSWTRRVIFPSGRRMLLAMQACFGKSGTVAGALLFFHPDAMAVQDQAAPAEPPVAYHAPINPQEILKVDEPMRVYFGERMRLHRNKGDQLRGLLDSILQPTGLNFVYDSRGTFDARETFRQRRGNCVSFAFLVVAVAREFGFRASFQNVTTPDRWDRYGKLVVSTRHMNVRVEDDYDALLVDLRPDLVAGAGLADMEVVSDERALAQFYDTTGFFELLQGNLAESQRCMTQATALDPSYAGGWCNRAALYLSLGKLVEARTDYQRALRADPHYIFAMDGYVNVLRLLGSPEDLKVAAKYERRAQSIRERNPYYHQRLAERAQEQGDWAAAEKHISRAIALKHDDLQFHEQRVTVLQQLGREEDARRAAAKLEKLRQQLAPTPDHIIR